MNNSIYTILGATGNTGSVAANSLLDRGFKVRVIGRSAEKLTALAKRGAEIFVGNAADSNFLTKAFEGVNGIYAMIGPDYASKDPINDYLLASESLKTAIKSSGVSRIVALSGLGADLASGTGPVVGLHHLEKSLAQTNADQLILRPGYFFSNFFGSLPLIKIAGINGGVHEANLPVYMTSPYDIGYTVANELIRGSFKGIEIRELLSEPPITMSEATRLLGEAIGKPDLIYVQFANEDYIAGLTSAGVSSELAHLLVEMGNAFNQGKLNPQQQRSATTTAPSSFASFVPVLAGAYNAG